MSAAALAAGIAVANGVVSSDVVGYQTFFLLVMAFCAITFVVAALIKIDEGFGKK